MTYWLSASLQISAKPDPQRLPAPPPPPAETSPAVDGVAVVIVLAAAVAVGVPFETDPVGNDAAGVVPVLPKLSFCGFLSFFGSWEYLAITVV